MSAVIFFLISKDPIAGKGGAAVMIKAQWVNKPNFAKIASNIKFGVALGLTQTAVDAQAASVADLKSTFTLRGRWFEKSNRFGIKIQAAKKNNLESRVSTMADWLQLHEKGGTKRPRGKNLAIPTTNVRRTKLQKVAKNQRPRNLKRSFVLQTSKGAVLYQRKYRGKRSSIHALYNLEPRARIKKDSTFFEPISQTVKKKLHGNIYKGIRKALSSMK